MRLFSPLLSSPLLFLSFLPLLSSSPLPLVPCLGSPVASCSAEVHPTQSINRPTLRSRGTAWESFQSPPFFPSLVSLLSSPIFTLSPTPGILGEGAGGGWDTDYLPRAPPPSTPQKTPQPWRLQGVGKRLSGWPSEGIVNHSGLENDAKMTSQRHHFGDF